MFVTERLGERARLFAPALTQDRLADLLPRRWSTPDPIGSEPIVRASSIARSSATQHISFE